ncbi:MAG: hypothetical protein F6J90_36135 [Moorea sp. SIOASIH]|uniref:hypothetical protein n=1 Tax=Moorena sp. SIOASIH TaxID=2607817 RepID=UPI0013B9FE02|nr:hypothetical protein [Moorena sp. SIOASIH]NEO41469.1 hypothetical protein [Moorena sp. SIOASIH]
MAWACWCHGHVAVEWASCLFHFRAGILPTLLLLIPAGGILPTLLLLIPAGGILPTLLLLIRPGGILPTLLLLIRPLAKVFF